MPVRPHSLPVCHDPCAAHLGRQGTRRVEGLDIGQLDLLAQRVGLAVEPRRDFLAGPDVVCTPAVIAQGSGDTGSPTLRCGRAKL